MRDRFRSVSSLGAIVIASYLLAACAAESPAGRAEAAEVRSRGVAVTLVTGDRVHVRAGPDGESTVAIEPGVGRDGLAFVQTRIRRGDTEEIHVTPQDAAPLVASGRVDPRLFDVTGLVRRGLDDRRARAIPLVVHARDDEVASLSSRLPAARWAAHRAALPWDKATVGALWASLVASDARIALDALPGSGDAAATFASKADPLLDTYALTIQHIGRDGAPPRFGSVYVMNNDTGDIQLVTAFDERGVAVTNLPRGTYDVVDFINSPDTPGSPASLAISLIVEPELSLDADLAIVLDARRAIPVDVTVDQPSAIRNEGGMSIVVGAAHTFLAVSYGVGTGHATYAIPTRPVVGHLLEFTRDFTLRPSPAVAEPARLPYQYKLAYGDIGRIPDILSYRVRDRDLAIVEADYRGQGALARMVRLDSARFVGFRGGGSSNFLQPTALPVRRTEYYTAGDHLRWRSELWIEEPLDGAGEVIVQTRSYRRGRHAVTWNRAPVGPAFGDPQGITGVLRFGDTVIVALGLFSPSEVGHSTLTLSDGVTGTATVSRDGEVIAESSEPTGFLFDVPPERASYSLSISAERQVPWSTLATAVKGIWTFESETAPEVEGELLPLIAVRASGLIDPNGAAPAGVPYLLTLFAEHQPGSSSAPIAGLTLDVSYDDGSTWRTTPVFRFGAIGLAVLRHPPRPGFVSLRTGAFDDRGSKVRQTVIRAYALATPADTD